jgi:hypothetical protein
MKANEAPESKFVYPDKLYARTNNNITLDISYAPQTLEAVEYTRTDAFIEKACEWLNKESESYVKTGGVGACVTYEGLDVKELVEDFEKYMKGE